MMVEKVEIIVRRNSEDAPQVSFLGEHVTTIVLTDESIIHLSNELNRFVLLNYPTSKERTSNSGLTEFRK